MPVTNVPAWQSVHDAQETAFCCVENRPLAQAVQLRSEVVVPSVPTNCPATQAVFGAQAVAALPSWSQVPVAQTDLGAVPPGQWLPASQLSQVGGEVGVPGVVCTVPASQAPLGRQVASLMPVV